jgi:hypothetical protein
MKRIILFLLVLSISFASFACTSKPKPESFKPLQVELSTVVFPDNPYHELKIDWIHTELIEALEGSLWVHNDVFLDQGGIFKIQLNDKTGDIYRFYAPSNGQSDYFVLVTQASNHERIGYVITQASFESFLSVLDAYVQMITLFQNPFVSVTAMDMPTTVMTNPFLLDSIRRTLEPEPRIRINAITLSERNKRFVLMDDHDATYTIYEDTGSSVNNTIIVVDRADQTQLFFRTNEAILGALEQILVNRDYYLNDYYAQVLGLFQPHYVYLGDSSTVDDAQLKELPTQVIELFNTQSEVDTFLYQPITEFIKPTNDVLFIAKSDDGTYLTVYAFPSTDSLITQGGSCWVSIGQKPFADANNVNFKIWITQAMRLFHILSLSPNDQSKPLTLHVDENSTYVFPIFDTDFETRPQAYEGSLNPAMIDYLQDLEALDWNQISFDESIEQMNYGFPYSMIITTSNGTRYYLPYNSNQLIVDEDPLTPGALVYTTTFDAIRALGDIIGNLEFLAQIESDHDFTDLDITHYTVFKSDETTEEVAFTEAQSSALNALLKSASLYKKTYSNFSWGTIPAARLTSSNIILEFYPEPFREDNRYGVVNVYDETDSSLSVYTMPIDEFDALLDLVRSYLK